AMMPRRGAKNGLQDREGGGLMVRGRLKQGVSVEQARADIETLARGLQKLHTQQTADRLLTVETELRLRIQQGPVAVMSLMLGALALCVLAVACANVAGLLLSRARA